MSQSRLRNPEAPSVSFKKAGSLGTAPRRPILFVMGGSDNGPTMETLDPFEDTWEPHYFRDGPSTMTWICSMGMQILVLESESERFRSFQIMTRTWRNLCPPPRYIFGSSQAFSGNHVYVLGGEKQQGTGCNRYDVLTDQWEEMTPMRQGRDRPASVCHEGKLYCLGGVALHPEVDLSSMEVLNLSEYGQWSYLPSMSVSRSCHSLVSSGRFLWAIGGLANDKILKVVERYDVEVHRWNTVRALPSPRAFLSASVFKGRIHVVGGEVVDAGPVSSVHVYDEDIDEWYMSSSLKAPRFLHGSCVVFFTSEVAK